MVWFFLLSFCICVFNILIVTPFNWRIQNKKNIDVALPGAKQARFWIGWYWNMGGGTRKKIGSWNELLISTRVKNPYTMNNRGVKCSFELHKYKYAFESKFPRRRIWFFSRWIRNEYLWGKNTRNIRFVRDVFVIVPTIAIANQY